MPSYITHTLGLPRIGRDRELKRATESFWAGNLSYQDLLATGAALRKEMWQMQREAGISWPCSNDFSFYDRMLDMSIMLGAIPHRFAKANLSGSDLYFGMARGIQNKGRNLPACEMTKWFDTNYHYIVPELDEKILFSKQSDKVCAEFKEALDLGYATKPALIGPLTYLRLGKASAESGGSFNVLNLLESLLVPYVSILQDLQACGAEWIQIEEPALALDLPLEWRHALARTYQVIADSLGTAKIMLATYFGEPCIDPVQLAALPVHGFHIDVTRTPRHYCDRLASALAPTDQVLSLGVVDGRNIWRCRFSLWTKFLASMRQTLGERLWIAPSCSLQHVPLSLEHESALDEELRGWLSFAQEKLSEVGFFAQWLARQHSETAMLENECSWQIRRHSPRIVNGNVHRRMDSLQDADFQREASFAIRKKLQQDLLRLPVLPTTTIGSFPQTAEIRKARAQYKSGNLSLQDYETFLKAQTAECVRIQEHIGLDVLVHGEFERNDMVEYFGEKLGGFAFSGSGWVQSYGTRYVKPPIIYGDVFRKEAMTVRWSAFAQSLTSKPMKGMLTGPITILQWSFVRDDQPRRDTAWQIALALRDEVAELEKNGIGIIQVDEPALREGLPLRKAAWQDYLEWSVAAFKLAVSPVRNSTQIHTHMCYADFADIMDAIVDMDADVITLEASRSGMELLDCFVRSAYPNDIGPGVYDIHSPLVPSCEELLARLNLMLHFLPLDNLWVNPDCGLKTRKWEETRQALQNMVEATATIRNVLKPIALKQ